MAFGFLKKIAKGVAKVGVTAVKLNPVSLALHPKATVGEAAKAFKILRPIAGTAAMMVPGIGPGVSAGLAVADKVIGNLNHPKDPKKRAAAQRIVQATKAQAKKGNVQAANAVTVLNKRAAAMRAAKGYKVLRTGFVVRG